MLINNKTSCQNSNFWSENEILIKNRNFCQKILTAQKYSSKINASENLKFSVFFINFESCLKYEEKCVILSDTEKEKNICTIFIIFLLFINPFPKFYLRRLEHFRHFLAEFGALRLR